MKSTLILVFCLLAWFFAPASGWAQPTVPLLSEVTVQHEQVLLSDLLPAGVSSELKAAAEKTILGRSPDPGSARVFSADQIRRAVASGIEISISKPVVVYREGWPLSVDLVKRALSQAAPLRGLDFSQARILPPPSFTTRTSDPQLELLRIHDEPEQQVVIADLRCHSRTACGSFEIQILLPNSVRDRLTTASASANDALLARQKMAFGAHGAPFTGPPLVQPGKPALLVIEDNGMTITEPVMPLKPARMGDRVRVFASAVHRSFFAQVAGADLLHPMKADVQSREGTR
jgi:hypothetical protein